MSEKLKKEGQQALSFAVNHMAGILGALGVGFIMVGEERKVGLQHLESGYIYWLNEEHLIEINEVIAKEVGRELIIKK